MSQLDKIRAAGFADVWVGGELSALALHCDCEAACADECSCRDAIWFHRAETAYEGDDQ